MTRIIIEVDDGKVNTGFLGVDMAAGGSEEADRQQEGSAEQEADEDERDALVSDLANCCEYLEESEVIKIRLIVSKAQKRKEMDGA